MGMRRLLGTLLALMLLAPAAQAKPKPKPGLKVYGFSVNSVFISKGTTVPPSESTNTCYRIGGPSGAPDSLTGAVFVRAIKIPKDAPTSWTFNTPFDEAPGLMESDSVFDGTFKDALARSKPNNAGGAFGGPTGKHDYFTYRMLPSGSPTSYYMAGEYKFKIRAKAHGKIFKASGKITLQCA
jgi:hypothetical protein